MATPMSLISTVLILELSPNVTKKVCKTECKVGEGLETGVPGDFLSKETWDLSV